MRSSPVGPNGSRKAVLLRPASPCALPIRTLLTFVSGSIDTNYWVMQKLCTPRLSSFEFRPGQREMMICSCSAVRGDEESGLTLLALALMSDSMGLT